MFDLLGVHNVGRHKLSKLQVRIVRCAAPPSPNPPNALRRSAHSPTTSSKLRVCGHTCENMAKTRLVQCRPFSRPAIDKYVLPNQLHAQILFQISINDSILCTITVEKTFDKVDHVRCISFDNVAQVWAILVT